MASLTILSPNGGETLIVDKSYPITWAFTGTIANVKIEYTVNNGLSWETIVPAAPNTGSYTWTVPYIDEFNGKIRISEAVTGSPSDQSDGPFFIVTAAISGQERAALIAFYNSSNGDTWSNNSGWKTPPLHTDGFAMPGSEGRWHGIKITEDHVTRIEMYENNLTGSIAPELGNLPNLAVGKQLRELPVGSTFNRSTGVFNWQPGVVFLGKYHLSPGFHVPGWSRPVDPKRYRNNYCTKGMTEITKCPRKMKKMGQAGKDLPTLTEI